MPTTAARAAALVEHYRTQGVQVDQRPFAEADRFLLEALYSEEPVDTYAALIEWLVQAPAGHASAGSMTGPATATTGTGTATGTATATHHPNDTLEAPAARSALRLERERAVEHPVLFGNYFGIHCKPDVPREGAPAVLFVNTGASHHIGDGRIFVLFARRLAALGIASLRMDLGGPARALGLPS